MQSKQSVGKAFLSTSFPSSEGASYLEAVGIGFLHGACGTLNNELGINLGPIVEEDHDNDKVLVGC